MATANSQAFALIDVEQVLEPHPLMVSPEVSAATAIAHMGQTVGQRCSLQETDLNPSLPDSAAPSGYVLIVTDNHPVGIFTERDLVRLVAAGIDLATVTIADVMTQPVITLKRSELDSIFTLLTTLRQHRIRQLPIVDDTGALVSIATQTSIRQAMHPFNFLKLRRVGEVMTRDVVQATVTDSLLNLARRMTQHQVSCIVITQRVTHGSVAQEVPIGIVTERDIVQFQILGLSLSQTSVQTVMSTPLFLVSPPDTLWMVQQEMQRRHIRRLVVANEAGGLAGIVTQSSLLQVFDPLEMLTEIEQIHQVGEVQARRLQEANQQLQQTNKRLQAEIAERRRLESILQDARQVLEERVGLQAAQLVQTDEALRHMFQARQQAQAQLEHFFEVTPSLLCIASLDGYFTRLNPSFARILGYTTVELLASPFTSFIHPDDLPATRVELERLAAGKPTIAFENRYRCQNGDYRWFSWNARASAEEGIIYAAARDVTERKQLEQALKQERNFIAAVLDTVSALVIVLDPSGRIVSFNKTCEQISGYSIGEVQGQYVWDVLIPAAEITEVQHVFLQLQQQSIPNRYENAWVCKDGTQKRISWSNTVLKSATNRIEYVIGTGIDVTYQRRTEQTLAHQYQQGQLLSEITRKIRESLDIHEILQTAVTEVRELLTCDRVLIIECNSQATGTVIQESVRDEALFVSLLERTVTGLKVMTMTSQATSQVCACEDLKSSRCSLYTSEFLAQWGTKSCIEVPIYVGRQLWGLITASQCDRLRHWEKAEIALMQQLANQMGVAIAHAQLLDNLEAKVKQRTHQLSQTNHLLRQEIQERTQIENTLRESQQKLAGILDNADEAIISIDSQQRIVLYNHGAERIFGYTFDEMHHQPLDILLPDNFQAIHRQHVQNFAGISNQSRQMANRRRDVCGRRKTGEAFPAEASISKLETKTGPLFTVILKDVSEQRQSEAALRRSEARLRLTANTLPALICYVDTEQRYGFNNQTYEDWYGIPIAELQGRYIWESLGNEDYTRIQPQVEAALAGRQTSFETELTTPDGKSRCLMVTYIPEIDEHGDVKGFFGLSNDISDRKAAERMKDEFVSIVGHELRTPLTSIHGSLRLLASKQLGTLTPQGQEFLEISLKNTQRLTRLINDVLDLERMESGRATLSIQACNLADLMRQAAQAMQAMADTKEINLEVAPLVVTAHVDPDHIIQVLTNLLSNAIKFSASGTTVWLSACRQAEAILVQVKDQGRGIPSDRLEAIFERFQQIDASDSRELGGTGLGLAICKNIVQQHGGKIWVESVLGVGSTFFFTLPNSQ